jgi:hypothetical protein
VAESRFQLASIIVTGGNMVDNEWSVDQSGGDIDSISMPPEVLFYVIPYMTLRDILNMERVCKYLRHWIRTNGLLWRSLHIEPPLSKRIRDENLIELFKRANGQLNRLILVNCMMITEDIIDRIVISSPKLYKVINSEGEFFLYLRFFSPPLGS